MRKAICLGIYLTCSPVDFKHTIIIQTSNIGSHLIEEMAGQPEEHLKKKVMDILRKEFRPEYLNRLDEITVFHSLSKNDILKIARLQLDLVKKRL